MVRPSNFIYFFTVSGFFIGLMFSIINFTAPGDILFYTLEITLFFYLFIHVAVMNFIDAKKFGSSLFKKKEYEEVSEYFVVELDTREKRMDNLLLDIDRMNRTYEQSTSKEEEKRIAEGGDHKTAA